MAIQKPKFALNFVNGARLDPRISCTRSTEASYFGRDGVMRWAAVNEPRLDFDPVTLACRGLLSEEARTNNFSYSEDIADAVWTKLGSAITADSTTAPDGTLADLLLETAVTDEHRIGRSTFSYVAGTTYTLSVFVKAAGRSHFRLIFSSAAFGANTSAYYDITAGTSKVGAGTPVSYGMQAVGNGWFRLWLTATATISAAAATQINVSQDYGVTAPPSYLGDVAKGAYFWGVQLEAGNFVTSYIRTTTAAVTRSHDVPLIDTNAFGTGWFNPNAGTIFEEFSSPAAAVGVARYPYSMDAGVSSTRISHPTAPAGTFNPQIVVSGADGLTGGAFAVVDGINKGAIAYSTATSRSASNGEVSAEIASVPLPGTLSRLYLGTFSTAVTCLNGHLRRFAYWDFKISDGSTNLAHLQKLTAL